MVAPAALKKPAPHGIGVIVELPHRYPAGQVVQAGNTVAIAAEPGDSVFVTFEYVPLGQDCGAVAPSKQYRPGGDGVHSSAANKSVRAVYVPAGHGLSEAPPVPTGQK